MSLTRRSLYPFALLPFAQIPAEQRAGLTVLDVPSGDGVLSFALAAAGFNVIPCDLFPEYLHRRRDTLTTDSAAGLFAQMSGTTFPGWLARALFGPHGDAPLRRDLTCIPGDMEGGEGSVTLPAASVDMVICAEGIEHVVDRHRTLRELRRVLKPGGRLLITTPNLMALRGRLAFFVAGQRALSSYVDEHTSVWGRSPDGVRTYHGHAFLLTYFQLRYSLHHCGLRIRRLLPSSYSPTSVAMLPLAPAVALGTWWSRRKAKRKFARMMDGGLGDLAYRPPPGTEPPYGEMFRHLLSPHLLLNSTMIVEAQAV